jgi:acetamidase/formamidase
VEHRGGALVGTLPRTEGGARAVTVPLAPFLGTMGVATASNERPHSVPPAEYGGNIDIKLLVEGATLYLPVQVEGALAYVGDPHFAQGDGEVALTALEASLRATLRFDVVSREKMLAEFGEVAGPLVRTPEYLAYAYLSAATDFDISQVVDVTTGVHGRIRLSDFEAQPMEGLS